MSFGATDGVKFWLKAYKSLRGTITYAGLWVRLLQTTSLAESAVGDELLEQTLKDAFAGPRWIYPVFNCIWEQSVSALQILAKARLYNRVIIAGV